VQNIIELEPFLSLGLRHWPHYTLDNNNKYIIEDQFHATYRWAATWGPAWAAASKVWRLFLDPHCGGWQIVEVDGLAPVRVYRPVNIWLAAQEAAAFGGQLPQHNAIAFQKLVNRVWHRLRHRNRLRCYCCRFSCDHHRLNLNLNLLIIIHNSCGASWYSESIDATKSVKGWIVLITNRFMVMTALDFRCRLVPVSWVVRCNLQYLLSHA